MSFILGYYNSPAISPPRFYWWLITLSLVNLVLGKRMMFRKEVGRILGRGFLRQKQVDHREETGDSNTDCCLLAASVPQPARRGIADGARAAEKRCSAHAGVRAWLLCLLLLPLFLVLLLSIPRALPTTEQHRHLPSASMEIEPRAAIAGTFSNP